MDEFNDVELEEGARVTLATAAGADTDMAALRADPHSLKIVQA